MRSTLAALILPLAVAGCGLASFDVPMRGSVEFKEEAAETFEPSTNVEIGKDIEDPVKGLESIDITNTQKFKDSGISINDVKKVELIGLRLKGESGATLDFMGKVEFWVGAEGLPEARVANGTITEGMDVIGLETVDVDLTSYAKTKMKLWAIVDRPNRIESDRKMEVKATFHVEL